MESLVLITPHSVRVLADPLVGRVHTTDREPAEMGRANLPGTRRCARMTEAKRGTAAAPTSLPSWPICAPGASSRTLNSNGARSRFWANQDPPYIREPSARPELMTAASERRM